MFRPSKRKARPFRTSWVPLRETNPNAGDDLGACEVAAIGEGVAAGEVVAVGEAVAVDVVVELLVAAGFAAAILAAAEAEALAVPTGEDDVAAARLLVATLGPGLVPPAAVAGASSSTVVPRPRRAATSKRNVVPRRGTPTILLPGDVTVAGRSEEHTS